MAQDSLVFTFDFRDWKYLSQIERFTETITDPQVIAGLKEGTVNIDFNKLTQRDQSGDSKFEVAGRVYFEAQVFGTAYKSFTTNGFLDKEGYVEPKVVKSFSDKILDNIGWVIFGSLGLILFTSCFYVCYRNKKRLEREHKEMKNE